MPRYDCPVCKKKILVSPDEHKRVGLKRVTEHIRSHGPEVKDAGNSQDTIGGHVPTFEQDQGRTSEGNEPEQRGIHTLPASV